jgi:hypothetical protein
MTDNARRIRLEIFVVFALSLGASAFYSIFSLLGKLTAPDGLANQTATIHRKLAEQEWLDLSYQLLGFRRRLNPRLPH